MLKKLPIGKQEFRSLIEGDFIYVDKTKYLVSLAESTVPVFLSRPRRFGKSLMLNTFKEVRRSFCELILNAQYFVADADILAVKAKLRKALEAQCVDDIVQQFKIIYSSIPYVHFDANKTEHFYSAVLLMYLQAAGFRASPERLGNKGRLDLSLHNQNTVYIFELKTDSATKAIEQILEKNYAGAYVNRTVILVGLRIDFAERYIVQHKAQCYPLP